MRDLNKYHPKARMIVRKEETIDKLSVIYSLTDKGRGMLSILREIQKYADKFL